MNLKQRFLKQSIYILIVTIAVTAFLGFIYDYFYTLLNGAHVPDGFGKTAVVVIENNDVLYNSEDFTVLQIKEMLMNLRVDKNYYEIENARYSLNEESFISQNGGEYRIITLSQVMDTDNYYWSLITFVAVTFIIVFIISSSIVQRQNMINIIAPITDLTREMEKLRIGELETAITERGYGELRELGSAIEQLRLQLKNSIYYQQRVDDNRKFLISSISHDLKTPVTSIRGYIDGVLDGVADTDEKKQYYLLKAIEKTRIINTMIDDLLLFSKLDLNQMAFEKENINIVNYMKDCIEDSSEDFIRENKNVILENTLSDTHVVTIDGAKFKRVVQNIFDNAKRSIKENTGELKVMLRETNSSIIIEFKDNGDGINEKDLPHVFDKFYRADAAREVKGSSGLGLAISKQIVEGLDGRIWAVSEDGYGASIIISLKKVRVMQ